MLGKEVVWVACVGVCIYEEFKKGIKNFFKEQLRPPAEILH